MQRVLMPADRAACAPPRALSFPSLRHECSQASDNERPSRSECVGHEVSVAQRNLTNKSHHGHLLDPLSCSAAMLSWQCSLHNLREQTPQAWDTRHLQSVTLTSTLTPPPSCSA
eukprot:363996-Chlamydomonas_euryale.AAC.2